MGSFEFKGIIPPIVTPLLDRDKLDVQGLEKLIEHVLSGGVHGLFLLGTTGEGPALSYTLKRELIERACRQVAGRVPVLVGVTDTAYQESIQLAIHAAKCNADAVVLAPPYYLPASQPELTEYFSSIADQLPLPLMLYNMPSCTKVNIAIETLADLLKHPNVKGFKDSSCDMVYFHLANRLFDSYPGKTILIGPEELLAESSLLGGDGGVCGGANIFPSLYVDLYNAVTVGDLTKVKQLHDHVIAVTKLYRIGKYASSTIKGIKASLALMGICQDFMAEPFQRFNKVELEKTKMLLVQLTNKISQN